MATGSQNMTTFNAKHIIGDSTNANWAGALLHSGSDGKTSSVDTWIFADDYGSASSTYGLLHRQGDDKFVFVGASTDRFWNDLNSGDTYVAGKLGIDYNPETSGNSYKLYVNGSARIDSALHIFPSSGNYAEGIRIHSYNSWSDITLCGNDNTGDTGTSANSWFIGNNNGDFYITRNGSSQATTYLRCISNVWAWNGTADGNISGNAATVTTTVETSNSLNPLGVTSTATTTIKRNTNITMKGGSAWVGTAYFTGTWWGVYATHNDTTSIRYGYIQINATDQKMYFRGENGVTQFNFNNAIYTSTGNISTATGNIWAGTAGDTTAERDVGVRSGAGTMYLYSSASTTGNRGLYVPAHGTGEAKTVILIDTNNVATFNGNASTATALTSNAGGGEQPIYFTGGKPSATTYALKATVNDGTASRIAYYSTARAISSGSIVTDGEYLGSVSYLSINKAHQTSYRLWVQGSIMATGNHVLRHETYDSKSATNGISEAISRGWFFQDKNGRDITRMLGYAQTNGNTRLYLQVRNYDVDTERAYAGIVLIMDKEGTLTYTVSNAENFRSAISAPSTTGSGASGSWGISVTGSSASCTGNAETATKLANARTISLTGSVTGSGSFDGSGNLSIATTTNHGHTFISNHSTIAKGSKPSSAAYLLGSWGFETGSGTAIKNRLFGFEGCVNTSGRSSIYLMAYQNTADSTASNTFSVWIDQDGTCGYSVSNAAGFRSAIGAGTSSLTIGTTASTAAAGNHNHDGDYVNVDGDTMTGTLNSCDILPATTATSASTGYNLGSNTKRYRAIYINQGIFVGPQGYTSSTTAYNGSTMGSSTFHSTRTTAGGGYYVRDADVVVGRYWYQVEGTTSVEGKATIQLGNDVATGTDKNASGRIRLFGSNTGYTDIDAKYGTNVGNYLNVSSHIFVDGSVHANNVQSSEGLTIRSDASSGNCAVWFANTSGNTYYWKMAVKTDNSQFIFYRVDNGTLTSKFWINSNGTTGTSSSRKIKHNIQNINFDTGYIIDRMQPVSYIVNGDLTNKTTYGFIYEDLIQVLPNVCDSAGETTGITYTAIIPVLTKEIQNLRRRLAAVENELSSYKSKT